MEVPKRRLAERAPDSTPHQGVGGEPAVGGEPVVAGEPAGDAPAAGATSFCPQPSVPSVGGEPAVGGTITIIPPWDPEYSKEDVAALRKRQEWWDLMSWVKESLRVGG